MKSILALVDHTLTWGQPRALKQIYELRFGADLLATLQFPKMLSAKAVVESGDGSWELERTGIFSQKFTIRKAGAESIVASYTPKAFKPGGVIQLEGGKTLVLNRHIWTGIHELQTDAGEILLEMKGRGFFKHFVDVSINRRALQVEELPALVMLLFYLILLARRDAAAHSAAH